MAVPETEVYGRRPAEAFERDNGLSGISRKYVLPDEMSAWTPAQMDRFLHRLHEKGTADGGAHAAEALATMNDIADRIIAANSELSSVPQRRNDLEDRYDFLAGVSAGYNPADITHYLQTVTATRRNPSPDAQMAQFGEVTANYDRLARIGTILEAKNGKYTPPRAGTHFSARTLDLIEQQSRLPVAKPDEAMAPKVQRPK